MANIYGTQSGLDINVRSTSVLIYFRTDHSVVRTGFRAKASVGDDVIEEVEDGTKFLSLTPVL